MEILSSSSFYGRSIKNTDEKGERKLKVALVFVTSINVIPHNVDVFISIINILHVNEAKCMQEFM